MKFLNMKITIVLLSLSMKQRNNNLWQGEQKRK